MKLPQRLVMKEYDRKQKTQVRKKGGSQRRQRRHKTAGQSTAKDSQVKDGKKGKRRKCHREKTMICIYELSRPFL